MIIQKKSNTIVWKDIFTCVELPAPLKRAEELAYNLWWTWNPAATNLFERMDPDLWFETDGNPVKLLRSLSLNRIDALLHDAAWMRDLDEVYMAWQAYMSAPTDSSRPSVAYFSMEYGLSHVLKIYSGGLGVLAGDYLKEASDSNVPLTAVGFLYRYGYFDQRISVDGQQLATYEAQDFNLLPIQAVTDEGGHPLVFEVPFTDRTVYCHVWRVQVGRISLYLMDTDLEKNNLSDRQITHNLYGGNWENRMKQEYLLGIGGILLLQHLGISKEIYHMNEGHAALISAQRLADYVEQKGLPFDVALEVVRSSSLYTVHTPVPAGHDYFDEEL
ncbi:alpha-glucan family phosphorylase, partial [Porphyromonas loveana]